MFETGEHISTQEKKCDILSSHECSEPLALDLDTLGPGELALQHSTQACEGKKARSIIAHN